MTALPQEVSSFYQPHPLLPPALAAKKFIIDLIASDDDYTRTSMTIIVNPAVTLMMSTWKRECSSCCIKEGSDQSSFPPKLSQRRANVASKRLTTITLPTFLKFRPCAGHIINTMDSYTVFLEELLEASNIYISKVAGIPYAGKILLLLAKK